MNKLLGVLVFLMSLQNALLSDGEPPEAVRTETKAKLDAALGNWRAITPDILRKPENADLLSELRKLAKNVDESPARVPLLKLGDADVIESCLKEYRTEDPNSRRSAMSQLRAASNPDIIPLLASDLSRNESTTMIFFEDNGMLPLSVAAATVIRTTVLESPRFSREVKEWARQLPAMSDGLRDGMRVWWKVNKDAIIRKDYEAVVAALAVHGADKQSSPSPSTPANPTPVATPLPSASPVPAAMPATSVAPMPKAAVWPWVGGIFVLAVTAFLVWRPHA